MKGNNYIGQILLILRDSLIPEIQNGDTNLNMQTFLFCFLKKRMVDLKIKHTFLQLMHCMLLTSHRPTRMSKVYLKIAQVLTKLNKYYHNF